MRWMFFLLVGCGKPEGGAIGSQGGEDTSVPEGEIRLVSVDLVVIDGGAFTLGETDIETYADFLGSPGEYRTVITASDIDLDDFLIAQFPFPGVEGAAWFTDGATRSTVEALGAALADFSRRVCTISELLYAAAGPNNNRYPYGNSFETNLCDPDDENPQPIGTFTSCESDLGVRDFQVRSTWGQLDSQIVTVLNSDGDQQMIGEDVGYGIWGGNSRTNTIQAPTNFGFHSHGDDPTRYTDDGFRVCADQPPTRNEDLAYERWIERAIEAGSFEDFLSK